MVAMAADLVPRVADAAHEVRMPLGDVAEHVERRRRPGAREHGEEAHRRLDDAVLVRVPACRVLDQRVVPVLDIDGEDADAGRGRVVGFEHGLQA
jgi:hypothetical protein